MKKERLFPRARQHQRLKGLIIALFLLTLCAVALIGGGYLQLSPNLGICCIVAAMFGWVALLSKISKKGR